MSAENPSNKISEILRGLAGNYQKPLQNQSLKDLSPVRKKSLMIFQKLDSLSDKYVKHGTLKTLVMSFVRPHITKVISQEIPEDELKQVIRECFELLKDDFTDVSIAKELKQNINPGFETTQRENGTRKTV